MKKLITYRSSSVVAISANNCGGRIRFMQDSKGGSYYATDDETKQKAIEGCYLFAEGRIKVAKVEEIVEKADSDYSDNSDYSEAVEAEKATDTADDSKVYDEVTKCVDAIAVLRRLGVEGALSSKAKILEAAKAVGVEFPKL